jgi:DNA adenine methylase
VADAVKPSPDAPKRPALRYYGGKFRLAPWIISHFPPHQNYVEPCGGAASVLLQKPRSPLETYNDLDGNVVNFFRVLRDRPDELIRKIRLTPWARAEFELCRQSSEDSIENARRFFVSAMMGISQKPFDKTTGMKTQSFYGQTYSQIIFQINDASLAHLWLVVERLTDVQIENRDYKYIIDRYDNSESLFYVDPPYVSKTRTTPNNYAFEWTNTQHIQAADLLRQTAGYVIVSGYACQLYTELYEAHGWKRVDKEAQTNSGGKRIESLWLSPRTVEALGQLEQLSF